MEPVITSEGFLQALQSGSLPAIIGAILLVLAPAVLYITNGKVSNMAGKIISLCRGVAVAVGGSLVSAAASGGEWRITLIVGLVGLFASQGHLYLIRDLIPEPKNPYRGQVGQ